ncbi:acetylornithine/succinylornithine family transaminase [Ruminococcus champanellensis]|uniref:Acetylornithine aminotransferase n=1 Tax=Ruminococcus champanellensis (strain DSM 18848 / JCM 17042 / KCTC 15320 / 18P13) TaxID=213810 RepID=D4LFE4_RUMC1|nr:acetylornithine/succinylornithine family transaminase [Ruminococcus champanellensis]MED9891826.1 acetylornithine/succinylornithine family transaminase [Ruminococcus champanellensis]CBL18339.1 acetylornithine aminotransferase apoenzyme [Ruminococcus champanellensis 18P13 = JCM 17042]
MDTIEQFDSHVMQTYDRLPLVMESGSGRTCTDEDGKRYLDFGSGIGTNSLGYCDPAWADAVCAQVRRMQHTSNYYYTKVQADFAERLCQITGYKRVFFGNSGAEANECAIKLARKYSFDKYGAGRNVIITLRNSFHGRTMATLSATGQDCFHNYFFPFPEGFVYAEANDIDDLLKKMHNNVCAVMLEYIQGEGGVVPLDSKYVDQLYDFCAKRDILVIADEVQTGVGRTGTFLAGEQYAKKADITTLAKGLGGGLPIGACLANGKCADVLTKGMHGSTFGGNPVVCAGGLAVLEQVAKPDFLAQVLAKGAHIRAALRDCQEVTEITGLGLMLGLTLKTKQAADVKQAAFQRGLLVLTAKDKVRLLPPLNITIGELDSGLAILKECLSQ